MSIRYRLPKFGLRLYAAWYMCIAIGFLLLGVRACLLGAPAWTVGLRWLIAAGFAILALAEWRKRSAPGSRPTMKEE
ncbi:MAG: hypothetical protein ACE141_15290 [Bryobacteraceae bacterium]